MGEKPRGVRITARYELEVRDKEGKLIEIKKGESHSFLENFIQMLYGILWGVVTNTSGSVTNTGGLSEGYPNVDSLADYLAMVRAGAGYDTHGIWVGSGTTPVAKTDYNLASKISHGTGAGQLDYGYSYLDAPYQEAGKMKIRMYRNFTNLSGSPIDVNEAGIVVQIPSGNYVLIVRDVFATTTTVPDGATLTVRYYIEITAP